MKATRHESPIKLEELVVHVTEDGPGEYIGEIMLILTRTAEEGNAP
jgi:hypothetical protein